MDDMNPFHELPEKNFSEEYTWDTEGHELVTRPLTALVTTNFQAFRSSDAMEEIKNYLDAIHGTPNDPYGVT